VRVYVERKCSSRALRPASIVRVVVIAVTGRRIAARAGTDTDAASAWRSPATAARELKRSHGTQSNDDLPRQHRVVPPDRLLSEVDHVVRDRRAVERQLQIREDLGVGCFAHARHSMRRVVVMFQRRGH
jgi:hypothetical protein